MTSKILNWKELKTIYSSYIPKHFPPDEVKPFSVIEEFWNRQAYMGLGFYQDNQLIGYALLVVQPKKNIALLDYYAFLSSCRGQGLGSQGLALLQHHFTDLKGIYIESEDSDFAKTEEDASIQKRRLAFYERNGAIPTGTRSILFGVHYQIFYLPVNSKRENIDYETELNSIYSQMFSCAIPDVPELTLRLASPKDGEHIWKIMDTVYHTQTNKSLFCCDELSSVTRILNHIGFGVKVCDKDSNIIACLLAKFPGYDEDNLGYDIALNKEELLKVVHMESIAVLPAYRGHHLQRHMITYGERLICNNYYKYFMATVSPDNAPSMRTFLQSGYQKMELKEKYGGYLRYIMLKQL